MDIRTSIKTCFIAIILFTLICVSLSGCYSEATNVNQNLNIEANNFNVERRITVYNARTDLVILQLEGYISLSNNSASELVVTCKVGENQYKKNYVYLNDYTLYVVEDITGTHTDPYHYQVKFYTNNGIEFVP